MGQVGREGLTRSHILMTLLWFQPLKKRLFFFFLNRNNISLPIPKKKGLESKFCRDRVEGVSPLKEDKFLSFQAPFLQTLGEADLSRCLNFLLDAHPKRD